MSFSKTLIEKRDAALAKADAIVAAAQTEERELTTEEDANIVAALDEVRSLDEQIATHSELEKRSAEAAELRKEKGFDAAPARVVSEARTYSPQADVSFVADAFAAQFNNDFAAKERLARHMTEERVERQVLGRVGARVVPVVGGQVEVAGRRELDRARAQLAGDVDRAFLVGEVEVTVGVLDAPAHVQILRRVGQFEIAPEVVEIGGIGVLQDADLARAGGRGRRADLRRACRTDRTQTRHRTDGRSAGRGSRRFRRPRGRTSQRRG